MTWRTALAPARNLYARHGILRVLLQTVRGWLSGDAPTQSAALAFYTLFSLAPVLLVSVAVAGAVFGEEATRSELEQQVRLLAGEQSAELVRSVLDSTARPDLTGLVGVVGVVTLLFGATAVFAQLQEALNAVWEVKPKPGSMVRSFLKKRLLSLGLVLVIGFLLLVSLVLSAALAALGGFLERRFAFPAGALDTVNFVLFLTIITGLFMLIFRLLPDAVISWRDVALGAAVTAVLFTLGKQAIGIYLGRTGVASAYGVAGSLVLLLLWVYYSSMLMLLGAGFTRVWSRRHWPASIVPEPGAEHDPCEKRSPDSTAALAGGLALLLLAAGPASAQETRSAVERLEVEVEVAGEGLLGPLIGPLHRNVLATLSVEKARKDDDLTVARLRQLHARAPEEIEEALAPFGHYRVRVRSELGRQGDRWVARYEVEPGPRIRVEELAVEVVGPGATDPGFERTVRAFPLGRGDELSHVDYEEGKQAFVAYAAAAGYLDAEFDRAELRVDLDRYRSEVALTYDSGPRYRFGEVRFHQDALDPRLLRGYVTFEPGEPFSLDELAQLQDGLSNSPYFRRVEVVPRRDQAVDLQVPIDVDLVPAARQKWDFGVGYGTDTGPRATAGLEVRRVNRRGHRAETDVTASEIERSFAARYLVPGGYPRTDVVTYSLGYSEEVPETSRSETALAGVGLTRSRGDWREAYGLTFQRTDFEVGSDSGISELLVPETNWSRVEADDRLFARKGEKVELRLRGAEEALVSDSSFVQLVAEGKAVRTPLGDRLGAVGPLRLIGRVRVGQTWTSDLRRLPPAFRFFAGGDQSVRGYGYQELGPRDEGGEVIGGEALLAASLEADSLFLDLGKLGRWGAAVFYDVGGAGLELGDGLEQGVGAGLRWLSPIGLVRADVAWAVSEPGAPVRFHLTIGPDL